MRKPSSPHAGVPARDDRGFTLVELIVAIVILAIIVIPLLNTFVVGAKTAAKATAYGNATDAAQNLAETVQAADAETLLSSPGTYISGATISGNTVTASGYAYGGRSYDATVTLTPQNPDDSSPVSSNLDYSPDMTGADSAALEDIQNRAYPNGGTTSVTALSAISDLRRTITIDVAKLQSGDYTVNIVFNFTGTIPYSYTTITTNGDGTTTPVSHSANYAYDHDVTSGVYTLKAENKAAGAPDYSICFYYQGFYKNGPAAATDTITVNTTDTNEADAVRVFLVDTAVPGATIPAAYTAKAYFRYQTFSGSAVKMRLLFSNLPDGKMKYYAFKSATSYVAYPQTITQYLVDEQVSPRKWSVDISVYPSGAEKNDANRVAHLTTTKLS